MTTDEIRELIQLVTESGIAELEVERAECRVRIRRTMPVDRIEGAPPVSSQTVTVPGAAAPKPEPADTARLSLVKSPIVGTFYECPSPGTPPFVSVGETVQPGKVLCIIESMKLMNEIEAEVAGVIESRLVANGQPVEYGEALFGIRPI